MSENPFGRLNELFCPAYNRLREWLLSARDPVLFAHGQDLVLSLRGDTTAAQVAIPPGVEVLKAVTHLPLTVFFLRAFPHAFTDDDVTELRQRVMDVKAALAEGPVAIAPEHAGRQHQLVASSLVLLTDEQADHRAAVRFLRSCRPLMEENNAVAAELMLEAIHSAAAPLLGKLTNEERHRLIVLNMGSKSARNGAQVMLYLNWLLDLEGEGQRMVFAEGARDQAQAFDILATFLADREIGLAMADDPLSFLRDVLGDPTLDLLDRWSAEGRHSHATH